MNNELDKITLDFIWKQTQEAMCLLMRKVPDSDFALAEKSKSKKRSIELQLT